MLRCVYTAAKQQTQQSLNCRKEFSATLSIFNLNGAFVRDYALEGNSGEVEILASEIGKGMYIYSLNQNGQEIISKRMIIK
jgi:hypothetical protein